MEKVTPDYFAGVETGGTNTKCIVASDPSSIISELVIPTSDPETTLLQIIDFFIKAEKRYSISLNSMGIASFGPLDLNPKSTHYGSVTSTPKLSWQNYPILSRFQSSFDFPIAIDTDVNAAAIAELKWGAGIGHPDFIYITVGTGIGGGIIANGKIVHGLIHPEIGHMNIRHETAKDPFLGNCLFHNDCLEGLASGSSIQARWGLSPDKLSSDHPAWQLEANYLAQMVYNLTLTLSPSRIILGGGVCQHPGLLSQVRLHFQNLLNNYLIAPAFSKNIYSYIVTPMLGTRSGILGAIALAQTTQ